MRAKIKTRLAIMQDFNASNAQSFKLKNNVKEKAWNQLPNFNLAEFLLI